MENLTNAMQVFILGSFNVLICNFMHQSVSVFALNIELVKNIHQLEKTIFPQLKLLIFILKERLSKPVIKCGSVFIFVFCLIHGPAALHRQGALTSCPAVPQELIEQVIYSVLRCILELLSEGNCK